MEEELKKEIKEQIEISIKEDSEIINELMESKIDEIIEDKVNSELINELVENKVDEIIEDKVDLEIERIINERSGSNIKEIVIDTILTQGVNEIITKKINGILDSLTVIPQFRTGVKITLAEIDNIIIYNEDVPKNIYLSLRKTADIVNKDKIILNIQGQLSYVPWSLNNKLKINLTGTVGSTVKLIIRYI